MTTNVLTESWTTDEQLEILAKKKRDGEILKGMVSAVIVMKSKVHEGDKLVDKEIEVAVFKLEGGVTAYCPAPEFSDYEYKSLNGFTGTIQEFIIDHFDLEDKIAIVSVRKADEIKREQFFKELEELEQQDKLSEKIYTGRVWGFNPKNRRIHVRVNGTDCFMMPYDWSWNRSRKLETEVQRGEEIQVKVLRFDKENGLVQVSRRHTMEDPFRKLERLQEKATTIVGRVSGVDPIHGIFVELWDGLEVKGIKPSTIEEPIVGDIVTCVIKNVDRKKRRARVVIVGYPQGKKRRKDVGAFLFE